MFHLPVIDGFHVRWPVIGVFMLRVLWRGLRVPRAREERPRCPGIVFQSLAASRAKPYVWAFGRDRGVFGGRQRRICLVGVS